MLFFRVPLIVTMAGLIPIGAMLAASGSGETLIVRVYDYANLSAKETVRLTKTAGLAFGHGGIHIAWLFCRGVLAGGPQTVCSGKMRLNEITVRLQPVESPNAKNEGVLHLGCALVSMDGGHYVTVFVPAVRAQAEQFGVPFSLVVGYVVAHEAGHCLLGPGHSYAGLMRSVWNSTDAADMSRFSLRLTKQEARKAVARLASAEAAAR